MEIVTRRHPWYTILPLTAILAFLLTLTGYWQLIFAAGLLAGVLMKRTWGSFAVGLVAGGLAWGVPLAVLTAYYPLQDASALLLEIIGLSPSLVILPYILALIISSLVTALGALLGGYAYALLESSRADMAKVR